MFRKTMTVLAILATIAIAGCASLGPSGDMDEHHVSFDEGV
jgi:hypothetical protein